MSNSPSARLLLPQWQQRRADDDRLVDDARVSVVILLVSMIAGILTGMRRSFAALAPVGWQSCRAGSISILARCSVLATVAVFAGVVFRTGRI